MKVHIIHFLTKKKSNAKYLLRIRDPTVDFWLPNSYYFYYFLIKILSFSTQKHMTLCIEEVWKDNEKILVIDWLTKNVYFIRASTVGSDSLSMDCRYRIVEKFGFSVSNANGILKFHEMCKISDERLQTVMFCLCSPSGLKKIYNLHLLCLFTAWQLTYFWLQDFLLDVYSKRWINQIRKCWIFAWIMTLWD